MTLSVSCLMWRLFPSLRTVSHGCVCRVGVDQPVERLQCKTLFFNCPAQSILRSCCFFKSTVRCTAVQSTPFDSMHEHRHVHQKDSYVQCLRLFSPKVKRRQICLNPLTRALISADVCCFCWSFQQFVLVLSPLFIFQNVKQWPGHFLWKPVSITE